MLPEKKNQGLNGIFLSCIDKCDIFNTKIVSILIIKLIILNYCHKRCMQPINFYV